MLPNGRGTWKVRPMPSRHRSGARIRVTGVPANLISPADGSSVPEISPNTLVLPAPLGPTIPSTPPAPTGRDRRSATTTLPKLLLTASSSSNGGAAESGIRRRQVGGDLHILVQRVVHHLHLERERAGALLPLHADRLDD